MNNAKMSIIEKYQLRANQRKMGKIMDKYCRHLDAREFLDAIKVGQKERPQSKPFHDACNVLIYIRASLKDTFMAYKVFFICNNPEERNLHLRTLVNHIWEFVRKVEKQIDKPLDVFQTVFGTDESVKTHIANIRLYYSLVSAKVDLMREIRNTASAHKDTDVSKQFQVMDNIDENMFDLSMVWLQAIAVSIILLQRAIHKEALRITFKQTN